MNSPTEKTLLTKELKTAVVKCSEELHSAYPEASERGVELKLNIFLVGRLELQAWIV